MLNVVAIMGRLARDPELRQTTTGKNVASFRIACDQGRRDANGQSQADWLAVERRPECCLGCGFEQACSVHGCAAVRKAIDILEETR
jgi:hypothetical protein